MTGPSPKRLWHFGDELTKPTFIVLFVSDGNADKADLCKCGYCQRSILFYVQKIVFGIPVVFIKPVIDASRSGGK